MKLFSTPKAGRMIELSVQNRQKMLKSLKRDKLKKN